MPFLPIEMEKENVISVLLPSFLVIGSPCRTLAGHTDGGVGIMVRDSNGNFVAGRALYVDNVFSALQVEAMAAREGGILAVEGDFTNVIF